MTRILRIALLVLLSGALWSGKSVSAFTVDPQLQGGFDAMYALDFTSSEQQFSTYVRQRPDDPLGYAAEAACVLFVELDQLKALDGEFYVNDKKLFADPKGIPDLSTKRRLLELTARARSLAGDALDRDSRDANAIFALALANGLEADYVFLVEKKRLAAAKPGRAGFDSARQLLQMDPEFYDAYIWTGVTNYVVASLPAPLRWLAKWRGYPGSKETALNDLKRAADKGSLLKPYAKILLAITFLRENRKADARVLLQELSAEFPANPLFAKHAKRLADAR